MRRLAHDVRQAARSLARAPIFTAVAVVSLGLALALNTTMFALADAMFHPYVPYPEPERIAVASFFGGDPKHALTFDVRYRAVRDGLHSYDRIAGYSFLRGVYLQTSNSEEYSSAVAVSPEFFGVLGVRAMLGRTFSAAEARGGATQGAVISYRLWNSLFRDRSLSENPTIDVARTRYTIIGVMPRSFHFPYETDVWLPEDAIPADASARPVGPIPVMHLRSGVSLQQVEYDLSLVSRRLSEELSPKRPLSGRITPLVPGYPPANIFPSFVLGAVVMVLVIAGANLATMLIARGMARRRDTAIRVALGARRRDVIRETLYECALIVGSGIAIGILLTGWALYLLPHLTVPWVPDFGDLQPVPSWRVFMFALGVAVITILAAGMLPALRAAAVDPAEPIKEGAGTSTVRRRSRYNLLIIVEVALSTTLLMCSGLFVLVAMRLAAFNFQYAAKQLVTTDIHLAGSHADSASIRHAYDELIAGTARVERVRSVATVHTGVPEGRVILGENGRAGNRWLNSGGYMIVSPEYFRTMGIRVVRGRDFLPGDARGDQPVVIVDEQAAARLWPDIPDPVGRMVKLGTKESRAPWLRVIGVVQAIDYLPRRDVDLPPEPAVHVVLPDDNAPDRTLLMRGDGVGGDEGRAALALILGREIDGILPSLHHVSVRPWLVNYDAQRAFASFFAGLFGAFAAFGLVLCAVGLYGVLAYSVNRRIREFAVRIALGSRRRDVMRLVVHDAAVTALAGVGIGAFVALHFAWPIIDGFSELPYAPAVALVAGELVLFAVAFLAALAPLQKAAGADPVEVLRAS